MADTGCGISDDDKLHVFDRFYQTRHHKESPFGGCGLGLNIASEYVAMHGGRITVADNMENGGNGTVFTIELPVIGSGGVLASEKEASQPIQVGAAAKVGGGTPISPSPSTSTCSMCALTISSALTRHRP